MSVPAVTIKIRRRSSKYYRNASELERRRQRTPKKHRVKRKNRFTRCFVSAVFDVGASPARTRVALMRTVAERCNGAMRCAGMLAVVNSVHSLTVGGAAAAALSRSLCVCVCVCVTVSISVGVTRSASVVVSRNRVSTPGVRTADKR